VSESLELCGVSVVEAAMAEQLELESNDGLTLLSSQVLTSPTAATEGRVNAAFVADSNADNIGAGDTRRQH